MAAHLLHALLSSDSHRAEALDQISSALDDAEGQVQTACRALGVPPRTFSDWRQRWPELDALIVRVRDRHGRSWKNQKR